jgi:hypothetical protein
MALDHDVSDAVLGKSNRGRQADWSGTNDHDFGLQHGSLPASRNASLLTSTLRFEIRGDFVIGSSRKERVSILKTNGSTLDIDFVKIPRHLQPSERDLIPLKINGLNLSRLPAPRTSNHMSDAIALEQSAATTPSDFNMPDIPASLRALMAEFGPKMARRHRRSRRHDDHCVLGSLETDFPRRRDRAS